MVPQPKDERQRLEALKLYEVLDTLPDAELDDITRLASVICQTPIALISLVDADRQWFKSRVGLDVAQTERDVAFCAYTIMGDDIFEVDDPTGDERFRDNPLVTGFPHIRYYAGAPLVTPTGYKLGSLCVINAEQHQLNAEQKEALRILARSVINTLELKRQQKEGEFFRTTLDEVAAIAVTGSDGRFEYVNQKFGDLLEREAASLLGEEAAKVSPADLTASEWEEIATTVQEGRVFKGRIKNQSPSGRLTWSNLMILPYRDNKGNTVKTFSIRTDITNDAEMLHRFEEAEHMSHTGTWEANVLSGSRYWSREMYELAGISEPGNEPPQLLERIDAQHRSAVHKAIQALLSGQRTERNFEVILHAFDGQQKWVCITLKDTKNAKGEVVVISGTVQDITARKMAEIKMAESLAYIRDLYDNAPCGYHSLDDEGNIKDINATELSWLGYSKEEIAGRKKLQDIIAAEDVPDFIRQFQVLKRKGVIKDYALRLRCKDGQLIDTLTTATAQYDKDGNFAGCRVTAYDVREIRKALGELERSEAKYRSLVEETSQLSYTTDVDGRYTYVSPRLKQLIGYDDDEILGKQFAFIWDDEWRKKTIGFYINQLNTNVKETVFVFPIRNSEGKKIWLEQVATLKEENGTVQGFRCVLHDITERRESEEKMREAVRLAREAKQMQQSFLGKMSHEIRTPMNGVVGLANLLRNTPLNEKQQEYIEGIRDSASNLLRIINDILDISKIEAGKVIFEEIDFDIHRLVSNLIFSLKPAADEKNLVLASNIDRSVPAQLVADPVRLNQVLTNLAGNAVKFTETGSVIVTVKLLERHGANLVLEFKVTDTGIGIASEKLGTIFETFTQAESNTTRKYGGTGLGLSIARQLIEQQGGTMQVTSEPGRGTTFTFTYSCREKDAAAAPATGKKPARKALPRMDGYRILLVEDNVINQKVAVYTLENWGAVVTVADRGMKAIKLLEQNRYDLILMDIQMPEMSGFDTTRIIRNELGVTTPIVAMTASAMQGEKNACLEAGMNDYFSKPFEYEDLNVLVHKWVTGKSAGPSRLFDLGALMEMVEDDRLFAREITRLFIEKVPDNLEQIQEAIGVGDVQRLFTQVHNLRGTVGIFGKKELDTLLNDVERQLAQQNLDKTVKDNITELERKLRQLIAEAREELPRI